MAELTQQLLYAPSDKRIEQVRRAEKFHDEIQPGQAYPFDFVNYRVTGYRTEQTDETVMEAQALAVDLRLLIDSLSRSAPIPVDVDDPVEAIDDLAGATQYQS